MLLEHLWVELVAATRGLVWFGLVLWGEDGRNQACKMLVGVVWGRAGVGEGALEMRR